MKTNNQSKKVYVQPSMQKLGLISEKTKTNDNSKANDNPGGTGGGAVLTKGS